MGLLWPGRGVRRGEVPVDRIAAAILASIVGRARRDAEQWTGSDSVTCWPKDGPSPEE